MTRVTGEPNLALQARQERHAPQVIVVSGSSAFSMVVPSAPSH
jgi:hypothetical protein